MNLVRVTANFLEFSRETVEISFYTVAGNFGFNFKCFTDILEAY